MSLKLEQLSTTPSVNFPNENPEAASQSIDWQSALEEYLSPEDLRRIEISTSAYTQMSKVDPNQITIAELTPYFNPNAGYNQSWQALLVVVYPGFRELPFVESSPGSWLTHIFIFPHDLAPHARGEYTQLLLQAFQENAGLGRERDDGPCIEISIMDFPPRYQEPHQPDSAIFNPVIS